MVKLRLVRWSLIIAVVLVAAVAFSLRMAVDVPLGAGDGPYQVASGLHRLAAGQFPGADFYPYLGVGLLYFLFPPFAAAGANIAASVFAAYLGTLLAAAFSIALIGALLVRSNRMVVALTLSVAFVAIAVLLYPNMPTDLVERISPGNSFRPLRSFIPYLVAGAIFGVARLSWTPIARAMLMAIISGSAVAWSNDYGVPTAVVFTLVAMAWAWIHKAPLRWVAALPLCGIVATLVFLTIATAGHPLRLIGYNIGVSRDQYWYFACWSAACRIFSLEDLLVKFLRPAIGAWFAVPLFIAVVAIWRRSLSLMLLLAIGAALLGGGVVAAVGGHLEFGYASAFVFWCKAVAVLTIPSAVIAAAANDSLLIKWLLESISASEALPAALVAHVQKHVGWFVTLLALAAGVAVAAVSVSDYRTLVQQRRSASDAWFLSPELGGYLPKAWERHIALALSHKDSSIVEDYWGLWSAATRARTPYSVDTAMHALGPARAEFAARLTPLPDFAVLGFPAFLGHFAPWGLSANWFLYGPILANFEGEQTSPTTTVWRRRAAPLPWPAVGCTVDNAPAGPSFSIASDRPGYFEVRLSYDASALGRRSILMAQNNLNYAVDADGYVAIDSRAREWTFPVMIPKPDRNRFSFRLETAHDVLSSVRLLACEAREIVAEAPFLLPPIAPSPEDTPFDLGDSRWLNGVHRDVAAFFVSNTEATRERLKPGNIVKFYDGRQEKIVRQIENGPFLEVYLDSIYPLHGGLGYPHRFTVSAP